MNTVQTSPAQSAAAPSDSTPNTANETTLTLARGEVGFIQNLDTDPLAVKLGTSCSTSDFSMILQAGTAQDDGKGGFTYITDYVGAVSVCAMSGTARYIAWKRALG